MPAQRRPRLARAGAAAGTEAAAGGVTTAAAAMATMPAATATVAAATGTAAAATAVATQAAKPPTLAAAAAPATPCLPHMQTALLPPLLGQHLPASQAEQRTGEAPPARRRTAAGAPAAGAVGPLEAPLAEAAGAAPTRLVALGVAAGSLLPMPECSSCCISCSGTS